VEHAGDNITHDGEGKEKAQAHDDVKRERSARLDNSHLGFAGRVIELDVVPRFITGDDFSPQGRKYGEARNDIVEAERNI
jgi:hypothetical protein